jgi:hypothetical protein
MPLYTIRRMVPGAQQDDVDAASLRAIFCAYEYSGLKWIRSFWDQAKQELLCVYEATSPDQIREHSNRARLPCDEVTEVVEFGPEQYIHG